jgi:peptidoglycan/LPS O-acetylase OafA/YrhL
MLAAIVRPIHSGRLYQKILEVRALRSVGKYSYGMYVFHMLIIVGTGPAFVDQLKRWMPTSYPVVYALIVCAVSYCVAFVSYHGFEKHFLKLKHRFTPVRSAALQPST